MSKAFLKSMYIANVSDWSLYVFIRSELKLKTVCMVECLVLNPFCNLVNSLCCSRKVSICLCIRCSKNFLGMGSSEIGRRSSGPIGLGILGIGIIVASFHLLGNILVSIEVLIILKSKSGLFWKAIFHILEATSGRPLDL